MYFAMDELGIENLERISHMYSDAEKWDFIYRLASEAGFDGIQITSTLYEQKLKIDINKIPSQIKQFRLTYHIGGIYDLSTSNGLAEFANYLAKGLETATMYDIEDVSFHPPFTPKEIHSMRDIVKNNLYIALDKWLPKYKQAGIPLTMETHVSGKYFVFQGLEDYSEFVKQFSDLGVLIDVSHNCYDGYSEEEILAAMKPLQVNGLHLSDAISGIDFQKGTHLPISLGKVNFYKILEPFADDKHVFGALEIKAPYDAIKSSLDKLKKIAYQYVA